MSSSLSPFSDFWHERLQILSFCPICETKQHSMQAKILEIEGNHCLVHMTCRKCHNAILALVQTNASGVSSVGMMTDLSFEDVVKFQSGSQITLDDVISSHTYFYTGAWKELMEKKVVKNYKSTKAKRVSKEKKNS